MRLVIDISDERPEAAVLRKLTDPEGYLLRLVRNDQAENKVVDETGLMTLAEIFADGQNCISAAKSQEEVDQYIHELRDSW